MNNTFSQQNSELLLATWKYKGKGTLCLWKYKDQMQPWSQNSHHTKLHKEWFLSFHTQRSFICSLSKHLLVVTLSELVRHWDIKINKTRPCLQVGHNLGMEYTQKHQKLRVQWDYGKSWHRMQWPYKGVALSLTWKESRRAYLLRHSGSWIPHQFKPKNETSTRMRRMVSRRVRMLGPARVHDGAIRAKGGTLESWQRRN